MQTITISIGNRCNSGRDQLSGTHFADLIGSVDGIVGRWAAELYFTGQGSGEYNGIVELNHTWVFAYDPSHSWSDKVTGRYFDAEVAFLQRTYRGLSVASQLSKLARNYGQECIAVTVGATTLVGL
jgi:hypothetical protein